MHEDGLECQSSPETLVLPESRHGVGHEPVVGFEDRDERLDVSQLRLVQGEHVIEREQTGGRPPFYAFGGARSELGERESIDPAVKLPPDAPGRDLERIELDELFIGTRQIRQPPSQLFEDVHDLAPLAGVLHENVAGRRRPQCPR